MQPFRRVTEVRVGIGAPWKVIRVQPILREMLGIKSEVLKKPALVPKPAPIPLPPVSEENAPKLVSMQAVAQDDVNAKRLIEKKMKMLDEVVVVLQQAANGNVLPVEEIDGYWLIKVMDAESMLKDRIKVSRAQILGLQVIAPDRLSTVNREKSVYFRIPIMRK
jgi:hypothetical protein